MSLVQASLEDRYVADDRFALIGGVQALVRLMLEQRRLDAGRGLRTGIFVSGYPGSPLGGLDRELERARGHLGPAGVVFTPGINEELAATAVAGTQLVGELPGRQVDGVTGFWFGKAPGLDRAADAIRHGNTSGTAHLGGAVALIGDDPLCKSSTLPSSCELMAESLVLPLFSPGYVADIVRLGLHAVAMSREAGLWTAIKIVSDVADSSATVDMGAVADAIPEPPRASRGRPPMLLGASAVAAEHDLMGQRTERARSYGREHKLNRVDFEPDRPRSVIVAPGPSFATLKRALEQLGIDEDDRERLGLRLVRVDLVWPLHPGDVIDWADGVDQVIVVEDKRPFVERQIREALYGRPDAPLVLGKHDAEDGALVPADGAVDADVLARRLGRLLGREPLTSSLSIHKPPPSITAGALSTAPMTRTPYFCSGCPHNLSTRAPEDQLVGAGIGCHALIALDPAITRGQLLGAPQMGGEGAQWIGMEPFTSDRRYVQNIGDGTFHHSGSLAIRAAVAAGVKLTFRLLYNDAIAMTGGQQAPGRIAIDDLTRWLEVEGVTRVIVTTEDPASFSGLTLAPKAEVRHRDRLDESLEELGALDGVTVLIHADRCATEERRLRKRGKLPTPAQRAWINERVCEGCGDCGRASSCLSVIPVDTKLGRKTAIHQASCTQDFSCLEGDCPSFVLVTPDEGGTADAGSSDPPVELPQPTPKVDPARGVLIRMPGIGGTGVVTVSQILQMAVLLDGRWASGLDQTGLAQKGGAVISDIRIADSPQDGALRAGRGEVDVLLAFDILGAVAPDTLRSVSAERTIAVGNLHVTPTAAMVTDVSAPSVPVEEIVSQVEQHTRAEDALWLDAGEMAERLFADHMPANLIMLGAAYQHGCLPVSDAAIERAIELNRANRTHNRLAFRWGRAAVVDRLATARAMTARESPAPRAQEPPAALRRAVVAARFGDELHELIGFLAADLCDYHDLAYALRYVERVSKVLHAERAAVPGSPAAVTAAYARGLHKLMAYKDEYEVARLHLDPIERARREAVFGPGAKAQVMLHPPLLRAMGMQRKLRLGRSAEPLFRVLRAARRLRGTPLDPFGATHLRRVERALIDEYRATVEQSLGRLTPKTQAEIVELAELPELIRGYETIKLENIERYRQAVEAATGGRS